MTRTTVRSVWWYFLLLLCLSLPFYWVGAVAGINLAPGVPAAALGIICPAAAAAIMIRLKSQARDVVSFFRRAFDVDRLRSPVWYAPALLLMPSVMTVSYLVQDFCGDHLPLPQASFDGTFVLCVFAGAAAICEELGWSGFATEPLQKRFGALGAALTTGSVWAVWHFVPLLEVHRPLLWIVWWAIGTVALRVIIVWLYFNFGKSIFLVSVFHASINVTWQLFPVRGSDYNPVITGSILVLVALVVTIIWGPKTLARQTVKS